MAIVTPNMKSHDELAPLSSRYVTVDDIPWQSTQFPGVEIKVLMEDEESGMMTALTRLAPGAVLPDHTHEGIEQSWVLEGTLEDHEGAVTAGNYVWRPAGSRHVARTPDGCLVLGFFQKPNTFHDQS
ncbi:MAG: cupin domain-containing protein [Hyphomicrobiaceae bacterium]